MLMSSSTTRRRIGYDAPKTSRHFVTSPASVLGSVKSFGPLLSSWRQGQNHHKLDSFTTEAGNNTASAAISPFWDCSIFRSKFCSEISSQYHSVPSHYVSFPLSTPCRARTTTTCYDEENKVGLASAKRQSYGPVNSLECIIEHSVRHLCSHMCYLKAYASVRAWVRLRTSMKDLGIPVDSLLRGWTCRLISNGQKRDRKRSRQTSKTNFCTVYVDPNGEEFYNVRDVLRFLGVELPLPSTRLPNPDLHRSNREESTEKPPKIITPDPYSPPRRGRLVTSSLHRLGNLSPRSIIESDFFTRTGASSCPSNKGYNSKKRRLASLDESVEGSAEGTFETTPKNEDVALPPPTFFSSDSIKQPSSATDSLCNPSKVCYQKDSKDGLNRCSHVAKSMRSGSSVNLCSPLGLLEELFINDPWALLLSTMLLNKTNRQTQKVDAVIYQFLSNYPDAQCAAVASPDQIEKVITSLGLGRKRSQNIVRFSREYLQLLQCKRKEEEGKLLVKVDEMDGCGVFFCSHPCHKPLETKMSQKIEDEDNRRGLSKTILDNAESDGSRLLLPFRPKDNAQHSDNKHLEKEEVHLSIPVQCSTNINNAFHGSQQGHEKIELQENICTCRVCAAHSYHFSDEDVLSLYGCGHYALDAYRIFIRQERLGLAPQDEVLLQYLEYQRGIQKVRTKTTAMRR